MVVDGETNEVKERESILWACLLELLTAQLLTEIFTQSVKVNLLKNEGHLRQSRKSHY